ncbi:DUF4416 family protein [candidate division KSB1 bacterium]|nr:DUF4416 family protein [candidate division KSB1 bacterium]
MGALRAPDPVKLFVAITFSEDNIKNHALQILTDRCGDIDHQSPIFEFIFTNYYAEEMGCNLRKQFLSFETLIQPEELIDLKLFTNDLEDKLAVNKRRIINIDPGYINAAKVVLATTKDFSHRIYLGKRIYGDVHMRFINGKLTPGAWTYPDYSQDLAIDFFTELKNSYKKQLRLETDNSKRTV